MNDDIIDGISKGRNLCVMDFDLKTYHDGRVKPLDARITALEESPSGGSSEVNKLVRMGWMCEENGFGYAPDDTSWWTTWKHFGTIEQDFQLFKLYPEEFSLWEVDFEVLREDDSGVYDDRCVIRCNPWYCLPFDGFGRKKWRLKFGGGTFNYQDLDTGETITAKAVEADVLSNPREMNVLEAAFSIGINTDYPSAHPKLRIYSVERIPYPHKDSVGLPDSVVHDYEIAPTLAEVSALRTELDALKEEVANGSEGKSEWVDITNLTQPPLQGGSRLKWEIVDKHTFRYTFDGVGSALTMEDLHLCTLEDLPTESVKDLRLSVQTVERTSSSYKLPTINIDVEANYYLDTPISTTASPVTKSLIAPVNGVLSEGYIPVVKAYDYVTSGEWFMEFKVRLEARL